MVKAPNESSIDILEAHDSNIPEARKQALGLVLTEQATKLDWHKMRLLMKSSVVR